VRQRYRKVLATADGDTVALCVDYPEEGRPRVVLTAGAMAMPVTLTARQARALSRRLLALADAL
jgi:hypothetical protein